MGIAKRKKAVPGKRRAMGIKAPFPERVEPMLCQLVDQVPSDENYVFEVKLDGYRITAHFNNRKLALKSRKGENYKDRYPPVTEALEHHLNVDVVLDGEVVVANDEGKHDFTLLQSYQRTREGHIYYYIFDILWLNGYDLTTLPLYKRRDILNNTIESGDIIKVVDEFEDGEVLFEHCQAFGFEGIVGKKKDSPYIPGDQGRYWVKVKHKKTDEFVVVGYVPSESGKSFKTLLLGKYAAGELRYIHHSGGGYTERDKKELFPRLKKTVIKKPLVVNLEDVILDDEPTWVKPMIVIQVELEDKKYKSGRQRHPIIYLAEREDKRPEDVVMEEPLPVPKAATWAKRSAVQKEKKTYNEEETTGTWEEVESRPITSRKKVTIEAKKLELVNLEKKLWHDVAKEDLVNYYKAISPWLLPYLKDRPMALYVCLNGPHAAGFFLRGLEGHYPAWADVYRTKRKHPAKGKSPMIEWLVCNDLATIVYLLNLECIDIHPWSSRTISPNYADYIVIDLDPTIPDTKNDEQRKQARAEGFVKAMITALAAKDFLDKHKIRSFVKTSGKTGLHLYLPCGGFKYAEGNEKGQPRIIAENICNEIHKLVPDITTTSFSQSARSDKVYVDPSQNDYADRVAVAYCIRATHQPMVSAPLEWSEVNEDLTPENFTIYNMIQRVKKKGDVWRKGFFDKKVKETNFKALKSFL